MKLPNINSAIIPLAKITDYLLSPTHHRGKSKAAFFSAHGFSRDEPALLAEALRQHALDHDISASEPSPFGTRIVINGSLISPTGENLHVRVIWFIDKDKETPRFVTAYPVRRKSHDPRT